MGSARVLLGGSENGRLSVRTWWEEASAGSPPGRATGLANSAKQGPFVLTSTPRFDLIDSYTFTY